MGKLIDLTGLQYGKLTVLEYLGNQRWKCRCECGKITEMHKNTLIKAKSCGCERAETMKKIGISIRNMKTCVVCGKEFYSSPSSKTITCSHECSSKHRSEFKKGTRHTEKTKKQMSETAKSLEIVRPQLQLGTPAAQKSPKGGRFVTNSSAKSWTLLSPDGIIYKFVNLNEFIRKNIHLFDTELTDENVSRIAHGFYTAKRNTKKKANTITYKGWSILSWGDEKNIEIERKSKNDI